MQEPAWSKKLRRAPYLLINICSSGGTMQKSQKNAGFNTMFYSPYQTPVEIHSGFLIKSPPPNQLKRWHKRFFVLSRISEQEHQLEYFKSKEKKETCGKIKLSNVTLLVPSPKEDKRWPQIQKTFNCPLANVLYIETNERGYFLIGEDSKEMDTWFLKLFKAMKKRPHRVMSSEDLCSGLSTLEIGPKVFPLRMSSTLMAEKQDKKKRSLSDPSSNAVDHDKKAKGEDFYKQSASMPLPAFYDHPASYMRQVGDFAEPRRMSLDSVYESMKEIKWNGPAAQADYREVRRATNGSTTMQAVSGAFHRLKSTLSSHGDSAQKDRDQTRPASDLSSSSSENGGASPVDMLDTPNVRTLDKQSSAESVDNVMSEERDFEVKRADLKKHLSITEVDGKPRVSGWTGQPQSVCLFHKGDQILAINDLHAGSLDEFNMYLSKSLKNEVKVTILRRHGCLPLHSPNCLCSD